MRRRNKIGRNQPCPCGSGTKFKHCCEGEVDWQGIAVSGADPTPHLSIRGRNILFTNRIAEALQLDSAPGSRSLRDYKKAFTAQAVREIHEAVVETWPPHSDIEGILKRGRKDVSGLYLGDYRPEFLTKGIVRHSIYSNKILVVDPFLYAPAVRDEYNPILNPDQYRAQTLKNVNLWLSLLPWIEAGIVEVIRT